MFVAIALQTIINRLVKPERCAANSSVLYVVYSQDCYRTVFTHLYFECSQSTGFIMIFSSPSRRII